MPVKRQPNKLHRRERSLSFEKGREDALAIERRRTSRKRTSGAVGQGLVDPRVHPYSRGLDASNVDKSPFNQDNFPRMPTLHHKRNAELSARRKSNKRRKADHAREADIRAMSRSDPVRPAAEPWQSGRPIRKETKKAKGGLGLSLRRSWERAHQDSDISLPLPGSIHSSLSDDSEHVSFKVSALEALAPRPTLRYTVHPRHSSPPAERPDRHVSVRHKVSERQPIPEATIRAHKRIDDLADDLTASDLRQLMERDGRRRAKKEEQDRQRLERRLARRAEKEKAAEREGRQSPPNLERGVLGRESVGLGIDPESAVRTSSTPRSSAKSSPSPSTKQLGKRPAAEMEDDEEADETAAQGPLEHFHRTDSIPLDDTTITPPPEDPPTRRESSPRKRIILMPRASKSKSPPPPAQPSSDPPKPERPDHARQTSEGSLKKMRRSWSNLFRWGSRSRRRSGPSSFSNTSRDSMTGPYTPATPAYDPAALSRKISSGVPKRTLSRFREDLPELPLSPPQSREASPEPPPSAIIEQDSPELDAAMDLDEPIVMPKRRDTPMSPDEALGSVPASMPSTVDPSPEPNTVSLASVDSEGSWFGKKSSNRRSVPTPLTPPRIQHQRPATASTFDSHHDPDLPTQEFQEDYSDITGDDYLSRLANQRSSGSHVTHARASSDASDDARWGIVGGHQPHFVEPRAIDFVKSHEGLLNSFSDDGVDASESDDNADSIGADEENKENGGRRAATATRHNRSAKLLEVNP
ncbi:hypothetical protein M406DRAFT_328207 [Cryphonectria parasitica EP155]|uniref:Uncharacterized protein n=1 Tax=Cryphonectria parasitica (strain ATCC 38755 / EP155) TaxID=660469 RepID=A0A9P5CQ34_CRYP1|nr:uncharacterized protein M406DRAFT_328207 [Cryphonectria parasitica EP155]KAF3767104.1 hypothetical protein M406DRAFT_328207 [Cryphonectria parasitica EP155]